MSRHLGSARAEAGSVAVWMMMLPFVVVLLAGMSVDLWSALSTRGRIAAIADEAALAGSTGVSGNELRTTGTGEQRTQLDPVLAQARALGAVDTHPQAGLVTTRSATATPDLISVTVDGHFEFLFLRLVGATGAPISVTGHAAPSPNG